MTRIARIEVFEADLPVAGGVYRLSGGRSYESFDATVVCLTAEDGRQGWGESTPFGATWMEAHGPGLRTALSALAPAVLGCDALAHDRLAEAMDAVLAGHLPAKAAIDAAAWDLSGKAMGRPVSDLLGGRVPGPVPVISSIHAEDPEAMRSSVARHRAEGFVGHSIKIGAGQAEGGPALDAERVAACLADRRPGEWFLADANGGMDPERVLRFLALLPPDLDLAIEAPSATWRETLSVRARCRLPIFLDELIVTEADLIEAISRDACDGLGLKITKHGGLTRARRLRDTALAAGLAVSVQDTVGSEIALAAILHLAQSTPRERLRCALDTRSMVSRSLARLDAPIMNGGMEAPMAPGLGIEVDRAALGPAVLEVAA